MKWRLLLVLLVFSCFQLWGQRYPFYNLNVENGLIQSQARALTQDHLGHLWIGTLGGLSRYDGKSFTGYTVRDGMADNTVYSLVTDQEGIIWIGGPNGISSFNGTDFKHFIFQSPEVPGGNSVTQIRVGPDNTIWCISGNKLFSIQKNNIEKTPLPDSSTIVTAILPEAKDLWVAKKEGIIYHYHQKNWDSIKFKNQYPFQPIISKIFRDSRQQLWVATTTGIFRIINNELVPAVIKNIPLDKLPPIISIAEDKHHSLWLGTTQGVIRLTDTSFKFFNKKNGLSDNSFTSMLADAEGNIWMASDGQGVFRFSGAQFTALDESTGLPSAQVMSMEKSKDGNLFFGTYDAGLYLYHRDGKVTEIPLPFKGKPAIYTLKFWKDALWIGTAGFGLWKYDGKTFKPYLTQNSALPSNVITSLYIDPQNKLWMGTGGGAAFMRSDTITKLNGYEDAVQDYVFVDHNRMLLATPSGIKLVNGNEVQAFKTGKAPDSASLQCFANKGDDLWIGTSDNGLIYYNLLSGDCFVLNKSNGLRSDFVYNVIIDDAGNIWTGTGFGIHKITMKNGKPEIFFYGKGLGIAGMESNHNSVLKLSDGSILFGTTNGVVHYTPQGETVKPQPISIVLQSIKIFGENIADTTYFDSTDVWYRIPYGLRLPFKKNNITFTFHAITLSGTDQIHYRYRMEGLDAPWSDWSATNTVTFSALPPGKYVLMVQCSAGEGTTAMKDFQYAFEIITPFTKTWYFRLIILGGCILIGVSIQYMVNQRKQNRLKLVEALRREEQAKVRQRTAEDFHDEVGNKLTRINVLTNVLRKKIPELSGDANRIIEQIQDNTAQLYSGTRDILWSLKPANDNLYEILHRLRDFGAELFQDTQVNFVFTGTDERWKHYRLQLDVSRNLIMIFKEALNNCLKYSNATMVKMHASLSEDEVLHIDLSDNGSGFDMEHTKKGHGIDNMNVRAKRIHGQLQIHSEKEKGTNISLNFKLPVEFSVKNAS